jgi:tetraacyldisaccharide 4'-kinase
MKDKLITLFPRAWNEQASWLNLLRPLSKLYGSIMQFRKMLYAQGKLKSYRAPVPVMIIGNITVGGSGKTPLIIELVNFLQLACGLKVGVISRGYGGKGPFPALVGENCLPDQVGDEPVLIMQQTHAPMAVGPSRKAAIELLMQEHPALDIILADDGLQHLALQRDIEWIVLDVDRGLGNGELLPMGFLREPVERLKTATVVEHGKTASSHLTMQLDPAPLMALIDTPSLAPDRGSVVHAVAGIGHPKRFFDSLRQMGYQVIEHSFPDHHDYMPRDLDFPDHIPVITTAKDGVKIKEFAHLLNRDIWILPVRANLSIDCYRTLYEQLTKLGLSLPPFSFD